MDSTIRLRQLHQSELSGYIVQVATALLAQSGTNVAATGKLTGSFYPYKANPSGYQPSGAFASQSDIDSAIVSENVYIAGNYYPRNNPSGYITSIFSPNSFVNTSDTQTISGQKTFSGVSVYFVDPSLPLAIYTPTIGSDANHYIDWGDGSVYYGGGSKMSFDGQLFGQWYAWGTIIGNPKAHGLQYNWKITNGGYFEFGDYLLGQGIYGGNDGNITSKSANVVMYQLICDTGDGTSLASFGRIGTLNDSASISMNQKTIYDDNNNASIDWQNRFLKNDGGSNVVQWNEKELYDDTSNNTVSLGWSDRNLYDSSGNASMDWGNNVSSSRLLINSAGSTTLNWNSKTLYSNWSSNGDFSMSSGSRITSSLSGSSAPAHGLPLYISGRQGSGTIVGRTADGGDAIILGGNCGNLATSYTANGGNVTLRGGIGAGGVYGKVIISDVSDIGNGGYVGVGTSNPQYRLDVAGNTRVTSNLYAGGIITSSIDSVNEILTDSANSTSLDWENRILTTSTGTTPLDWENRILTDSWIGDDLSLNNTLKVFNSVSIYDVGNAQYANLFAIDGSICSNWGLSGHHLSLGIGVIESEIYPFDFYPKHSPTSMLRIDSGKIGINTTSPTKVLDVNGNAGISGSLTISGNISTSVRTVSGAFSVVSGNSIILVNTLTSGSTGTFPNASGFLGTQFVVKDWKGNAATRNIVITGVNSQTFDGSLSKTISSNYGSYTIVSDGQNWSII